MDAIIIERSAYEELQTGFNSFINKMKAMANRGTDKKMGKGKRGRKKERERGHGVR